MSDAQAPRPMLLLELKCSCGGALFVEYPPGLQIVRELFELAREWTKAHAAHHTEKPEARRG
jgi:hypothetical protein